MKPIFLRNLLLLFTIIFPVVIQAQDITIIHAGTIMETPGEGVTFNKTIIIKNGIILKVRDGFLDATELGITYTSSNLIDLSNKFVLPGFIDAHVHLATDYDMNNPHEWLSQYDEDLAFESIPYLKKTIEAGFTTVRDMGGKYKLIIAIQNAIQNDLIIGPRIIAATSPISTIGGPLDINGYRPEVLNAFETKAIICSGADDCRKAVRTSVKHGAEFIKVFATGSVLGQTETDVGRILTDDELYSIVETSKMLGKKVAAHAHQTDGINAALRAGVNSIEHGTFLNDESIELFTKTGAYLVPTLLIGVVLKEELESKNTTPPNIAEKIRMVVPQHEIAFKKALKGNVRIAFGTDATQGICNHGTNAREFELMVLYGMQNEDAIVAATINAADLLGMSNKIGTIEAGKYADIIAVEGNPLEDISVLKNVQFVMKEGAIIKNIIKK